MGIIAGIQSPAKGRALNLLLLKDGGALPEGEKALITVLETGTEAETVQAIRALAALGGKLNHRRFAAIMKDDAGPDELRTEAARALLEKGTAAEAALAVCTLGGTQPRLFPPLLSG